MIGAGELSEAAKALEMAAKEKREEFIAEHHYSLMSDYARLAKRIREVLGEQDEDVLEFDPVNEEGGEDL